MKFEFKFAIINNMWYNIRLKSYIIVYYKSIKGEKSAV